MRDTGTCGDKAMEMTTDRRTPALKLENTDYSSVLSMNLTGVATLQNGYVLVWKIDSAILREGGGLFVNRTSDHYSKARIANSIITS